MNFIEVFIIGSLFSGCLGHPTPTREKVNGVTVFEQPHVFLTLSSVAGINGDAYLDTEFELNWYRFEEGWTGLDWVGIFDQDPELPTSTRPPLTSVRVEANSSAQGYFKTGIRFGRPNITSEDEVMSGNCLGFWIAYFREETLIKVNCFRKYPRWMNNLSKIIGDKPLSLLMIPGTHDAGAIREYDGLGSEVPGVRYSVTQEEQLYRQFIHGIRYVDIRVAHYPETSEKWWINHGSARYQPLYTLFDAIRRFVGETNEIIFMDFHGFPVGFEDLATHDLLLEYVQDQIGDMLLGEDMVPPNPTPNQVWATNKTVILTYQVDSVSQQHPFLWPYLIHAWGNKNTVPPLEEYFREVALPTYGCSGVWWSAMAEMTPTSQDSVLYPLRGLRGFAQMINIPLTYWWMERDWYSRSMIVSTDFFLGNNIIEMAVEVNLNSAGCAVGNSTRQ